MSARPAASKTWWKAAVALLSVLVSIAAAEALLRWTLFHTTLDVAAKNPAYYARDADEIWIYRHLFAGASRSGIVPDPVAARDTRIEFYKRWPASLEADGELGYVRKPNVRLPCHETTALATRGTHEYDAARPWIAFFGDSFVESAACSDDTLTTKLEQATGVDVLNYGIGGYGLDQVQLYFERLLPTLDRDDRLVLIGLIEDDLDRVLLKVRTSPKPYFTVDGDRLVLHTDHIHPDALGDAFVAPPGRFYLYDFLRGRLGTPVYATEARRTRGERKAAMHTIARLLFARLADERRRGRFRVAVVVLPTPGAPFDPDVMAAIRGQGLPLVDLQACLRASGRPDTELYAELHPTSLGNRLLAECLAGELKSMDLLR